MPRSKPYTKKLAVLDVVLSVLTQGGWVIIIGARELYRFAGPSPKK